MWSVGCLGVQWKLIPISIGRAFGWCSDMEFQLLSVVCLRKAVVPAEEPHFLRGASMPPRPIDTEQLHIHRIQSFTLLETSHVFEMLRSSCSTSRKLLLAPSLLLSEHVHSLLIIPKTVFGSSQHNGRSQGTSMSSTSASVQCLSSRHHERDRRRIYPPRIDGLTLQPGQYLC